MASKTNDGEGTAKRSTQMIYDQCVQMRKRINKDLVPLMTRTVASLNSLNRRLDIVARELAKQKEAEDG